MVEVETEIKKLFLRSPAKKRFSEIKRELWPIFEKKYSEDAFKVILSRKLKRLEEEGTIKRDDEGHKRVFYSLVERARKKVAKQIKKEEMKKNIETSELQSFTVAQKNVEEAWRLVYDAAVIDDFAANTNFPPEVYEILSALIAWQVAANFKINVLTPLGAEPPILQEEEILKILFLSLPFIHEKITGKIRPFSLVVSFTPQKMDEKDLQKWLEKKCAQLRLDPEDKELRRMIVEAYKEWWDWVSAPKLHRRENKRVKHTLEEMVRKKWVISR